jgi:hypothetical protein
MKRTLGLYISALAVSLGLMGSVAAPVGAINVFDDSCTGSNARTSVCRARSQDDANSLIRDVIRVLLFIVGTVSVIMIIVGGIRYTLSNGDAGQIKSAKDTVLYAVVGLVVALLAYAIVNFVVARF